jgi:hypothetical protein
MLLAALAAAGCSGGGSSSNTGGVNDLTAALQDLDLNADGTVTVLTFESASGLSGAGTGNFSASGGQTPTGVTVDGRYVTITWDERVSPANTVSVSGLTGVEGTGMSVSTSDSSAPTFTVSGDQNVGWGNDIVTITFSGVNVAEETAEATSNWVLTVNGTVMPMTGTVCDFDAVTQTMTMELGNSAALWSSFTLRASGVRGVNHAAVPATNIAGTATGDSNAPTLVAAEQDLDADPLGRVVRFQFSKPMSPNFSTQLSHYGAGSPDVAVSVDQTNSFHIDVTFNNPMVPGVNMVELTGLYDMHGNAFPNATTAITQPSPVANAIEGTPSANTVANEGGDNIVFTTTQAFDPESALDASNWTLSIEGNPVDLSTQTFEYDIENRTTTITLDFDLSNGDDFVLTAATVVDVDGQESTLSTGTLQVAGDATEPGVETVLQNRIIDSTGMTVDVRFDEDVDEVSAENTANYTRTGTGTAAPDSATLLADKNTVRLVFDAPVVPGFHTVTASGVNDLAGNAMSAPGTATMSSTDTTAPTMTSSIATALAGMANDTLLVVFSDDMYESSIENSANWELESPIGSGMTLGVCTVEYVDVARRATLTLDGNSVNLQQGADYRIRFIGGVDLGGNTMSTTPSTGLVTAEWELPELTKAWLNNGPTTSVTLVFSEPCGNLNDLYNAINNPDGVRYTLHNGNTVSATSASVSADGLSATVTFASSASAGDTVDVFGVRDMAGNPMFPVSAYSIVEATAGDLLDPTFGVITATAVAGEENDTIVITFDRDMNPFGMEDMNNYSIDVGGGSATLGLFRTTFEFNGTNQVTMTLEDDMEDYNLQSGDLISVTTENLRSAYGTPQNPVLAQAGIVVGGDSANLAIAGNTTVRFDPNSSLAILVTFPEAMEGAMGSYLLNGTTAASSVSQLSPRVVRVSFPVVPIVSDQVDIVVDDLAGNACASMTCALVAADSSAPGAAIGAVETAGFGGDTLTITYNEPVTVSNSMLPGSYSITANGSPISLAGSTVRYSSIDNSVRFTLASGQEFPHGATVSVTISGVTDHAGNTLNGNLGTTSSGDSSAPTMSGAFVNYLADPTGAVIDVLFSEDVNIARAEDLNNWSTDGSTLVVFSERVSGKHYRLTMSAAMATGELLRVNNMRDAAGNTAGLNSINPVE